ncbi:uncharacterized protein VDAG_08306 [Verticillium dahliae VdLs.17]|uniref:Cation-transporting ATPase n=1 Tax=Verticillium dahliae (strain VdLs.17 / ATCC MYA-4575 / FGSC 10137) TaxID=498257 RepID=G2XDS4_VERDV|nr:uncharacterized protein VDAG_08306 [Verticillium dahliae VdLs.17]EGY17972.1 hypothetical protein VDAG_08306 [Verticillium dahliae VdLs.17]
MDETDPMNPSGLENGHSRSGNRVLYRMNSNQSNTSIFENVEMAHDELYSGPIAESLPTSVSAFSHRRPRADSTASFTYYHDDLEESQNELTYGNDGYEDAISDDIGDLAFGVDDDDSSDIESGRQSGHFALRRRSSTQSRSSVHDRLLRTESTRTTESQYTHGRQSQKVYMVNEDLTIVVAGFRTSPIGLALYILLSVSSLGLAWLLLRWLPRWHVKLLGRPSALSECDWVVIENQWGELSIMKVEKKLYGRPMSTIFGSSEKIPLLDEEHDPIVTELRMLNYRYVRLYFNQQTDRFILFSGWKDPNWADIKSVRLGLDSDEKHVREVVFGNNDIDIEQKSIPRLLVDEVFHPFYVFQIASLILWSLDEYYYYAIAIFLMSFGSITSTLIETRATMKRLREISRFECDVRVLRNGFWRYVSSNELVPGDIYEASDPNLAQFPSDGLLLSGDCIVNESMLTGESVPVSKTPATEEALQQMDLGAPTVLPEIARHFLFCGTKIIRARRPQDDQGGDGVALALVVRTGFSTTKGSLVRSMLFPKTSGFKFYRDSFRYVGVMAMVAMLGFVVSLINFIRLDLAWHLIIVRALGHPGDPNSRLLWESIDDSSLRLDEHTLLPLPASQDVDVSLPYNITNLRNYSLAISGDAFRWLVDFAEPHVLHRMLVNGKIYARMSPDEKHELVEKLQSIDYCVGFCGDGANDCGALKAADVGISLSEAEASVAAPFTSRNFDIACCPEGRAALVTSFSCFKYMSLYSAIQFTSVSFLYATASNLGDFQFLFIDLLLILPIAIFMGWAGPYPVLYKKRPTANLVSRKVLIPLLGQMLICIAIQATVYIAVREQPWYIPPKVRHDKSNIKNSENTVLFLVSCFEYILAGVVLNAGPPFRQKALKNWPFLATIAITLLLTLYMIMSPAHWVAHLMQLTSTSGDFQLFLVGLGASYLVCAWVAEKLVFQQLARAVGRLKQRLTRQPKKRKLYKTILEEMRIDSLSTV